MKIRAHTALLAFLIILPMVVVAHAATLTSQPTIYMGQNYTIGPVTVHLEDLGSAVNASGRQAFIGFYNQGNFLGYYNINPTSTFTYNLQSGVFTLYLVSDYWDNTSNSGTYANVTLQYTNNTSSSTTVSTTTVGSSTTTTIATTTAPPPSMYVTASDTQDNILRYWEVFINQYPGQYLGSGEYQNRSTYEQGLSSGATMNFQVPSGANTVYFVITQSGGSSYGTYSGSIGNSYSSSTFSGVDVYHALKVSLSNGNVTGSIGVALNPSSTSTVATTSTTTAPTTTVSPASNYMTNCAHFLNINLYKSLNCGIFTIVFNNFTFNSANPSGAIPVVFSVYANNKLIKNLSSSIGFPTVTSTVTYGNQTLYVTPLTLCYTTASSTCLIGTAVEINAGYSTGTSGGLSSSTSTIYTTSTTIPTTTIQYNSSNSVQIVRDVNASSSSTLIVIGSPYDNAVMAQIAREYGSGAPTGGLNKYGTNRITIACSNYALQPATYCQNILQYASNFSNQIQANAYNGATDFEHIPITNLEGRPVVQIVIGSTASQPEVQAAYEIANTIDAISAQYSSYPTTSSSTTLPSTTATYNYTTTSTVIYPPTENFSVPIYRGWNLVSIPMEYASGITSSCPSGSLSHIWQLQNGQYSTATNLYGGVGYWVYSYSSFECSIYVTGPYATDPSYPSLSSGWNLIGSISTNPTQLSSIRGSCTFTGGPFLYNTISNNYVGNETTLNPGHGYFVDVSSACNLGSTQPSSGPPAPP